MDRGIRAIGTSFTAAAVAAAMLMPGVMAGAPSDPSGAPPEVGIATDQPCAPVRAVDALVPVGVGVPDLEPMVLDATALGTDVPGWEPDSWTSGYTDDAQLWFMDAFAGDDECTVFRETGRLTGYTRAWERIADDPASARRSTTVHLFGTDDGAQAFLDWLPAALQIMPRTGGVVADAVDFGEIQDLGPGAEVLGLDTNKGFERYAFFRAGPLVGMITETGSADVQPRLEPEQAARALAARIGARGPSASPDATAVLSAGLPLEAWGVLGKGLAWDWFFGGCWDREAAARQSSDSEGEVQVALALMEQHGWRARCSTMYSPPDGGVGSVPGLVRVATDVVLFDSPEGAAAYWSQTQADAAAQLGEALESFVVPGMPDAIGLRRPVEEAGYTDTRVTFQRGNVLLTLFVHDRKAKRDHRAEIGALAAELAARAETVLGAG